jgi:hypothetical protein
MRDEDRTPSRVPSAAMDASDPASILYQHTVNCSTSLPYRDPGDAVLEWNREQGAAAIQITAGKVRDPATGAWLQLGLPWGTKPRLILAYLNAEALRTGSPSVDVEDSLAAFCRRIGLDSSGHNMGAVRDQLARLAAAHVRMAITTDERHALQAQGNVIMGFELWDGQVEGRRRFLWPKTVRLSLDYFDSLSRHAVPLDERAVAALKHSAMALDVYAWLAQRLRRVDADRPQPVSWAALKDQFGVGYDRVYHFRPVFRRTLQLVLAQYRSARLDVTDHGLILHQSPPPVQGRLGAVWKRRN